MKVPRSWVTEMTSNEWTEEDQLFQMKQLTSPGFGVGQAMAFSPEGLLAAGVAGTENHVCVCVVYVYSEVSSSCPGI